MTAYGKIRIGISGWTYAPWRGTFFPAKLPHKNELIFAASKFSTIEINGTFYSLQRPSSYERWAAATPDDFVFSVKAPRYITHIRRLKDVEIPLANFFASGILKLGDKLGPILWQFPPSFKYSPDLMEEFLALLPKDTDAARKLAGRHDGMVSGRTYIGSGVNRALRHAVEIRNESFSSPTFIACLRRHQVALVCADTVEWPRLTDLTSNFFYCRMHGSEELYVSGYDDEALRKWSKCFVSWAAGGGDEGCGTQASAKPGRKLKKRDVYIYFDNDAKVRAPVDAQILRARIDELLAARASN